VRNQLFVVYRSDGVSGDAYWISASDEEAARRAVAANTIAKEATSRTKYTCRPDETEQPTPGYIFCRLDGSNSRIEISVS
jgi:hypothetical protein